MPMNANANHSRRLGRSPKKDHGDDYDECYAWLIFPVRAFLPLLFAPLYLSLKFYCLVLERSNYAVLGRVAVAGF